MFDCPPHTTQNKCAGKSKINHQPDHTAHRYPVHQRHNGTVLPYDVLIVATGATLLVGAVVVALLVVALPGCVKHSVIPDEPDTITIRVSNNNSLDMNVYAVNQSMRIRLGTVTTASTQRFEVSLHQISPTGELQLLADPVGSRRTMRSEAIHVSAGQVVEWTLQADLRQSSLTIRS